MCKNSNFHSLRKGIPLLLIAFFVTNFSMAQKNHLSLDLNGIGYNNYLLKEDIDYLDSKFIIAPGTELQFSHDLSGTFALQTGISYQYRQYYDSYDYYYRYGEFALPAVISLHVLKKYALRLDWSYGVYFNLLAHMNWFEESSGAWYGSSHWYGGPKFSKFGLDLYSDIKLRYPVFAGREIFIAPFWMHHVIKKNYYAGMTLSSFGLKIGYTFKSF